ncbi:MAG: AAA family ATPase [Caldilineaceae bacterium]|nr:AAA family ATPase [Caldilineaceae bacterium]
MDLFDQAHDDRLEQEAPLAARMRPRTLDEFVGQEHIVGPGRLLRRAIQADQLSSLIFYGPPGTGKTTLARVIANTTRAHFIALNAVLSGVKEIRESIAEAQERSRLYGQRTILFVDEVHRFNKAQQDALLPWVENGTVIFIGATTENPYFEVNKALVSRSRIFQLVPLTKDELRRVAQQALTDPVRGYGRLHVTIDDDALEHLVEVANGDARAVLNALELAVETTGEEPGINGDDARTASRPTALAPGTALHITLAIAEESIQRRAVLYDKEGDYHFDTISAFIKSLRGSDPDAAVYWMAKMIYAGESPRFIFRRMLIFAGEDVGMADPNAIQMVNACAQAFEQVGLPEGRFHLALAALYLATARKSNTAFAFFDALEQVAKEADSGVPNHLKDANRDSEGFGHGEGYLYPHAYRDHWVAQQYLPTSLQGKVFYQPTDQGYEAAIRTEVARRREAQLAAMLAAEDEHQEVLTYSPDDPARERWLQRTISGAGERLGQLRDRVLNATQVSRHSVVLDLKAGSGLLTWEALRRAPEGGVYSLARNRRDADALRQMAERLSPVERPVVMEGGLGELPELVRVVSGEWQKVNQGAALRFDAIVGYNALLDEPEKAKMLQLIAGLLAADGIVSLAERVPRHTQRIYRLVDPSGLDPDLVSRWQAAEEAIYGASDDPLVNWDVDDLVAAARAAALEVTVTAEEESSLLPVSPALVARWFTANGDGRPSYVQHLAKVLAPAEIAAVKQLLEQQLLGQTVDWGARVLYLLGQPAKR